MARVTVLFPSAALAVRLLAGVPAAARAARLAADQGAGMCRIAAPERWVLDSATLAAARRLAPGVELRAITWTEAAHDRARPGGVYDWQEFLIGSSAASARADFARGAGLQAWDQGAVATLERAIIRATSKPGDGIVSSRINRPLSQFLTLRLLRRWPGLQPQHATTGTAILAVIMVLALLAGGPAGLVMGALLYQLASIADGIDGEIARATYRCTARGAWLDSCVDAATNLGFIAGVSANLWLQGNTSAAIAGMIGLAAFALGLMIIARRDRSAATFATFDAVKHRLSVRPSFLIKALTWLTMRDFFALALAVLILCGLAGLAMQLFLVMVSGWLIVVMTVMRRQA